LRARALPLTFITGFLGINFAGMVAQIDAQWASWLLRIGARVLVVILATRGARVSRPRRPGHRRRASPNDLEASLVRDA
jgi:hypothetical protein